MELSHTFVLLSSVDDLERMRSILPYQTLRFIHDAKASGRVYATIGKNEKRYIRIPEDYRNVCSKTK